MSKLDDLKHKAKDLVTGGKQEDSIEAGVSEAKEGLDRAAGRQNEDVPGPAGTEPMLGDRPDQPSGPLTG